MKGGWRKEWRSFAFTESALNAFDIVTAINIKKPMKLTACSVVRSPTRRKSEVATKPQIVHCSHLSRGEQSDELAYNRVLLAEADALFNRVVTFRRERKSSNNYLFSIQLNLILYFTRDILRMTNTHKLILHISKCVHVFSKWNRTKSSLLCTITVVPYVHWVDRGMSNFWIFPRPLQPLALLRTVLSTYITQSALTLTCWKTILRRTPNITR